MSFNEMMKKVRLEAGDSLRGLSDKTGINFSYIDKILQDWKNKGLTLKQIDEGTY